MELYFIIWLIGIIAGAWILLLTLAIVDAYGSTHNFIQYWPLFTAFWPIGLLIFVLWAAVQTYHLVGRILHS